MATMADLEYLSWLRIQPCAQCGRGPTEAHHATYGRGMGRKAPDDQAFPLCHKCHQAFHDGRGPYKDWDKNERRFWQEEQVAKYRDRFISEEVF